MALGVERDTLFTRREAAQFLHLKSQTLAKWAMTGQHLPVIRIGRGRVRYRLSDIEDFIAQQTTPAAPE